MRVVVKLAEDTDLLSLKFSKSRILRNRLPVVRGIIVGAPLIKQPSQAILWEEEEISKC